MSAFENLKQRQSVIAPESVKKVSAFDNLKQRQDLISTQPTKQPEEKTGILKSLVSAPLTMLARPFQLGAELLGATPEQVNKFSKEKLGGFVAPVPQNLSDVKKDVGRGIQTVSLGLPGIASAGAGLGLGTSLEQGNDLFSKETAISTVGSAIGGKLLGFIGKPLLDSAGKVVGKITPEIVKEVTAKGGKVVEEFMARNKLLPEATSKAITTGAEKLESVANKPFELGGKLIEKTPQQLSSKFDKNIRNLSIS